MHPRYACVSILRLPLSICFSAKEGSFVNKKRRMTISRCTQRRQNWPVVSVGARLRDGQPQFLCPVCSLLRRNRSRHQIINCSSSTVGHDIFCGHIIPVHDTFLLEDKKARRTLQFRNSRATRYHSSRSRQQNITSTNRLHHEGQDLSRINSPDRDTLTNYVNVIQFLQFFVYKYG
jgi:hypothetical protein